MSLVPQNQSDPSSQESHASESVRHLHFHYHFALYCQYDYLLTLITESFCCPTSQRLRASRKNLQKSHLDGWNGIIA